MSHICTFFLKVITIMDIRLFSIQRLTNTKKRSRGRVSLFLFNVFDSI
ncbi:hypothetical protein BAXH7_00678 [Bacillus amyloliquefaciens XH7]|nr:hypothetical protein BAXH7_00678 [Bacillus amyloliquefaciens XH7]QBG55104.1 hypothetical protein D2M30_0753 [Bacillus amyloliquefaciens]